MASLEQMPTPSIHCSHIMTNTAGAILITARDLFVERGLEGVSIRRIAKLVSVTPGAIYRHYESKEHLLAEVAETGLELFGNMLYKALEASSPEKRLYQTGQAYLEFGLTQPKYYEMIFMLSTEFWGQNHALGKDYRLTYGTFRFLVDRVRECMDSGYLKPGDPLEVATSVWLHAHGMMSAFIAGKIRMDEKSFRDFFVISSRHLVQGLAV